MQSLGVRSLVGHVEPNRQAALVGEVGALFDNVALVLGVSCSH